MSKLIGSGFTEDGKVILAFDDGAHIELTIEEAILLKGK